jgi:hypothetical protein
VNSYSRHAGGSVYIIKSTTPLVVTHFKFFSPLPKRVCYTYPEGLVISGMLGSAGGTASVATPVKLFCVTDLDVETPCESITRKLFRRLIVCM